MNTKCLWWWPQIEKSRIQLNPGCSSPQGPGCQPNSLKWPPPGEVHSPWQSWSLLGAPTVKGRNDICFSVYFFKNIIKWLFKHFPLYKTEQLENLWKEQMWYTELRWAPSGSSSDRNSVGLSVSETSTALMVLNSSLFSTHIISFVLLTDCWLIAEPIRNM